MITFNKTLLHSTFLVDEASKLKDFGFITTDDFDLIKDQNPILKSNKNILMRLGFVILGAFLFASIMGVIAFFSLSLDNILNSYLPILFGVSALLGFFACEIISKDHYRYGFDDAFILGSIGCIYGFVFNIISLVSQSNDLDSVDYNHHQIYLSFTIFLLGLLACLRYCHWFSGLISLFGLISTFYFFVSGFSFVTKLLPFLMLFFGLGLYFVYAFLIKKNTNYFYLNSLLTLKIVDLIVIYMSCNYFIVRELSEVLLGVTIPKGSDIPFSLFFWFFTFLVPLFYLYSAIIKKDKVFLNIGFFTFCFAIYSFRTYYSVLPIEIAVTLGGIALFIFSYYCIKKLKNNDSGITFKPDRNSNTTDLVNLEALVINSQVNMNQQVDENPMKFGGGGFSGGGAGDSF